MNYELLTPNVVSKNRRSAGEANNVQRNEVQLIMNKNDS